MVVGEVVPRKERFTRLERRIPVIQTPRARTVGYVLTAVRGSIVFKRTVEPNIAIPAIEATHEIF